MNRRLDPEIPLHPDLQTPQAASALEELAKALRAIPDPRTQAGTRHSIEALLGLLLVGMCCGCRTIEACLDFMRPRMALREKLGFDRPDMPSAATYSRLLRRLPAEALGLALGRWLEALARQRLARRAAPLAPVVAAVDGKTARGVGEHAVGLFLGEVGLVLDHAPVHEGTNELSAWRGRVAGLAERYPWLGVLTFDAAYADRSLAEALGEEGVSGLFRIRGNQPETLRRLERLFSPLPRKRPHHEETVKGGATS